MYGMKVHKCTILSILFFCFFAGPSLSAHYICLARKPEHAVSHTRHGSIILIFYSTTDLQPVEGMRVDVEGYQGHHKAFRYTGFTGENGLIDIPLAGDTVLYPGEIFLQMRTIKGRKSKEYTFSLPVRLPVSLEWKTPLQKIVSDVDTVIQGQVTHPFNRKRLWKYPVQMFLYDAQGNRLYDGQIQTDENGAFEFNILQKNGIEEGWHFITIQAGQRSKTRPVMIMNNDRKLPVELEDVKSFYQPGDIFTASYSLDIEDDGRKETDLSSLHIELMAGEDTPDFKHVIKSGGKGTISAKIPETIKESAYILLIFSLDNEAGTQQKQFQFPIYKEPYRAAFFHYGYVIAGFENLFGFILTDPLGDLQSKWVTMRIEDKSGNNVYYRDNFESSQQEISFFSFTPSHEEEKLYFHFAVEGHHFRYLLKPLSIQNYPFLFQPRGYQHHVGEMLDLKFITEKETLPVVVELERDGQILYSAHPVLKEGKSTFSIRLTEDMAGRSHINAHVYDPHEGQYEMTYPLDIALSGANSEKERAGKIQDYAIRPGTAPPYPGTISDYLTQRFSFISLIREHRYSSLRNEIGYQDEWQEIIPVGINPTPYFFPDSLEAH